MPPPQQEGSHERREGGKNFMNLVRSLGTRSKILPVFPSSCEFSFFSAHGAKQFSGFRQRSERRGLSGAKNASGRISPRAVMKVATTSRTSRPLPEWILDGSMLERAFFWWS